MVMIWNQARLAEYIDTFPALTPPRRLQKSILAYFHQWPLICSLVTFLRNVLGESPDSPGEPCSFGNGEANVWKTGQ